MKKRIKLLLALGLVGSLLLPNKAKAQSKLQIVTSFYPMYALTSEIVGDLHEVLMINSGNGIHGFEPSASDIAAIYDADIFIYHSNILESWTKNLEANIGDSKVKMIQAAEALDFKRVPELESVELQDNQDQSNLFDPHSWLDPLEAGREAHLIADALSEIDPDNESKYQANADKFVEKAEQLTTKYQTKFDALENKVFVTQHTAFYYLAERFGLTQLGVTGISAESEPSARQLNEVMAFVQEYNVKTIFVEPNVSDRIAKLIANSTGVDIVTLSPLESDPKNTLSFLENLEQQLETLSSSMQ